MTNIVNTRALARANKIIRQSGNGDKKVSLNAKRGTLIRIMNEIRVPSNEALSEKPSTFASD